MERAEEKAKEATGGVKEKIGDATGDRQTQAEGQADQAKGKAQGAVNEGKEKVEEAKEKIT